MYVTLSCVMVRERKRQTDRERKREKERETERVTVEEKRSGERRKD